MPVYLLTRKDDVDYDEYEEHLVIATSEHEARKFANEVTGDEGKIWDDRGVVGCKIIRPWGSPGVVISSFNAG